MIGNSKKLNSLKSINTSSSFIRSIAIPLLAWTAFASNINANPATTISADNPIAHGFHWTEACEDRVAAAQGQPIDIIFIGDSITQNFVSKDMPGRPIWDKHYANRNALNLGVGSDGTEHILWRLDHENIQSFTPKVVVLLAGVNDSQFSPEDIAAGVKAVLNKIQALYPLTKIVLMNILPTSRTTEKMKAANLIIQTYADNQTIFSLDLWPEMTPVGDNWRGVGGDHLHLTQEGYEIWAAKLDPLLDKVMRP